MASRACYRDNFTFFYSTYKDTHTCKHIFPIIRDLEWHCDIALRNTAGTIDWKAANIITKQIGSRWWWWWLYRMQTVADQYSQLPSPLATPAILWWGVHTSWPLGELCYRTYAAGRSPELDTSKGRGLALQTGELALRLPTSSRKAIHIKKISRVYT
jgi:hypothetical protein